MKYWELVKAYEEDEEEIQQRNNGSDHWYEWCREHGFRDDREYRKKPKQKKRIDYSKLPEGTIVNRYHNPFFIRGDCLFKKKCANGVFIEPSPLYDATGEFVDGLTLVENEPRPWFGGKCPVPKGVKVKVWFRNDVKYENNGEDMYWKHDRALSDIIAYQILGPADGWE